MLPGGDGATLALSSSLARLPRQQDHFLRKMLDARIDPGIKSIQNDDDASTLSTRSRDEPHALTAPAAGWRTRAPCLRGPARAWCGPRSGDPSAPDHGSRGA